MMQLDKQVTVYLHCEPVDFRKQINGLSAIVQEGLGMDVFSPAFYVFVNRTRRRIKILYWQRNGFCLWMKRLERDRFSWPNRHRETMLELSTQELQWLLDGFDIWRQPPHQSLIYASV